MEIISEMNQLPHDIEAERAVLGALIMEPNKMGTVEALIDKTDFYLSAHQVIFQAMEEVYDQVGDFEVNSLEVYLRKHNLLENAGNLQYLIELSAVSATAYYIESYAQAVKDYSLQRKLIKAAQIISSDAQNAENVQDLLDKSEKLILSIGENSQSNRPQAVSKYVNEAIERISVASNSQSDIVGLATGYIDLDKVTSGFQPDQLIIIAARPAVGKTAFALNIAQNVATKSKVPVAIFSLEMSSVDMVYRMLCAEGNINANRLKTGNLEDTDWSSLLFAADVLKNAPIFLDDTAGIRVNEIRAKCRRLKQENPDLGLIVIDYLQLIEGSGRENRQQEVSEISRQLKKLAKELSVPVIALSQLSRGVEHRQNKRPMLSDIRESGSIEQDADIVAFLYREDYHQQEGDEEVETSGDFPDNTVEVILAKNRSGARDTVRLIFTKEYNKFSSLTYADVPPI